MSHLDSLVIVTALMWTAAPAFAQTEQSGTSGMGNMPGMNMSSMGAILGSHMMKATVTAIDSRTGVVDVSAGSMALKVHFPPASLAAVKAGDSITIHLAFSKP